MVGTEAILSPPGPPVRESSCSPRWLKALLVAQIAWPAFLVTVWILYSVTSPIDRNYTAGEMLDMALSWIQEGQFYSPLLAPPFRVFNYPPLFFLLVKGMSLIGMPALFSGRAINLAGFVFSLFIVFRWMKSEQAGFFASLVFIGILCTAFPVVYPLGQFHFQLFASVFTLLGFFLLRGTPSSRNVVFSGLAFALACFVKHTQVIFPLAALAWIFLYQRQKLAAFLIPFLFAGALGSLAIQLRFGDEAWRHMIQFTVGTYSWRNFIQQFLSHFLPRIVFVVLGFWIGMKNGELRRSIRWWFFVISNVWLFTAARNGADWPYFVDWNLATIIWIGPWLSAALRDRGYRRIFSKPVSILFLFQMMAANVSIAVLIFINLQILKERWEVFPRICQLIPPSTVFVPSEDVGLVRYCGRLPTHYPFIMTNLANRGLWQEERLLHEFDKGTYPVLILPFDPQRGAEGVHGERWTPAMLQSIRTHYEIKKDFGDWKVLGYRS